MTKLNDAQHILASDHRIEIISNNDGFLALKNEWRTLNDSSSKGCIFTSWEWLYTWWEVYQNNGVRQLYILTCTDDHNKLIGIAPFQLINNPKKYFPCGKQLIMLGTGETDGCEVFGEYMDLIISPNYEKVVLSSFSEFIVAHKNQWHGLKFYQLLADSYVSQLFKAHEDQIIKEIRSQGFRTLVELPETYQAYLMSLKGKVRSNIKRMTTRLESEQQASTKTIRNKEDFDEAITVLAELNQSRRSGLKKQSAFDSDNFLNFHKRVAKRLNKYNEILINILYFSDRPVAANYQLIDRNMVHGYQSGFDVGRGGRYSLLTLLITQEIANNINNNKIDYFNFMYSENESSYKKKYTGITEIMYAVSYDNNCLKTKIYYILHGPVKEFIKKLIK
jgi:hypothetical protein